MKALLSLFNWKKRPETVWLVAIPLFVFALLFIFGRAILEIVNNGDWTFLIMDVVFIMIVGIVFIPAWKQYKIAMKAKAEYEARKRFYGIDK